MIKFKVKCDKEGTCRTDFEAIVAYNEILQCINRETEEDEEILWKWRKIVAHEGPLNQTHSNYMGSKYNLIVEWEDSLVSPTSLSAMKETNKAECAEYAKEQNFLLTPGWKDLKRLASKSKYLVHALRQAKLKSFRIAPKYKRYQKTMLTHWNWMQSMRTNDGRNLSSLKWINWWIMMLSTTNESSA